MNNKFFINVLHVERNILEKDVIYLCPDCENKYPDNPPKGVLKVCYRYDDLKK